MLYTSEHYPIITETLLPIGLCCQLFTPEPQDISALIIHFLFSFSTGEVIAHDFSPSVTAKINIFKERNFVHKCNLTQVTSYCRTLLASFFHSFGQYL